MCASPNGAWLASQVAASGKQHPALWLWRVSDGADFECSGLTAPISAMSWSSASDLLAICSGRSLSVWRFGFGGPGGSPPITLQMAAGLTLRAIAFRPSDEGLVCSTADGQIFSVTVKWTEQSGKQRMASRMELAQCWHTSACFEASGTASLLALCAAHPTTEVNFMLCIPADSRLHGACAECHQGEAPASLNSLTKTAEDLLVVGLPSGIIVAWPFGKKCAQSLAMTAVGVTEILMVSENCEVALPAAKSIRVDAHKDRGESVA